MHRHDERAATALGVQHPSRATRAPRTDSPEPRRHIEVGTERERPPKLGTRARQAPFERDNPIVQHTDGVHDREGERLHLTTHVLESPSRDPLDAAFDYLATWEVRGNRRRHVQPSGALGLLEHCLHRLTCRSHGRDRFEERVELPFIGWIDGAQTAPRARLSLDVCDDGAHIGMFVRRGRRSSVHRP